jgi:hypothetical protein
MLIAPVPETAVEKDGDFRAYEHDVRATTQPFQRRYINAIAQTLSVESSAH